jgi:hypothetical protein
MPGPFDKGYITIREPRAVLFAKAVCHHAGNLRLLCHMIDVMSNPMTETQ